MEAQKPKSIKHLSLITMCYNLLLTRLTQCGGTQDFSVDDKNKLSLEKKWELGKMTLSRSTKCKVTGGKEGVSVW